MRENMLCRRCRLNGTPIECGDGVLRCPYGECGSTDLQPLTVYMLVKGDEIDKGLSFVPPQPLFFSSEGEAQKWWREHGLVAPAEAYVLALPVRLILSNRPEKEE